MRGSLLTYGFYQDAGDWDGYFSHFRVPLLLLITYQVSPANFADRELRLPESGNGIPDILDEAAWLLRYHHRTRHALLHTTDAQGKPYGTGGAAGSRVAGDFFGNDEKDGKSIPSWEDNHRDYVVSGEDPFDSYMYAGLAAQMATVLRGLGHPGPAPDDWRTQAYDEGYDWTRIDWAREAAETFAWARAHSQAGDEAKGLGAYRFFAASALYRLTGDASYHEVCLADAPGLGRLEGLKTLLAFPYLTLPERLRNPGLHAALADQAIQRARVLAGDNRDARGFRFGGSLDYPVLVGQATSPIVEEALVGYHLTRDPGLLAGIATTADYVLGANPLSLCWPTRLGERGPLGIFNMNYWGEGYLITRETPGLRSGFDITRMPGGIVPYGPTAHGKSWIKGDSPYGANWPDRFVFPTDISTWPAHELWYDQWSAPPSAEYTVHQTIVASATVFGVLCAPLPDAPTYDPDR
jgi:endoglucanase